MNDEVLGLGFLSQSSACGPAEGSSAFTGWRLQVLASICSSFQSARLSLLTLLLYYRGEQLVSAAMGIVALTTNDVIGNTRSRPVSVLLRRLIQHIGTNKRALQAQPRLARDFVVYRTSMRLLQPTTPSWARQMQVEQPSG